MIYSFLLIGQSNMAGRGVKDDVEPICGERLFMMRNGRFQPLHEPVCPDRPFSGVCLASSFAKHFIADHEKDSCALIPCADGGSSLDEWAQGEPLYEHAVFCAKMALRSSKLAGILWHQGEADTAAERYPFYREKFLKLITALKQEIGAENVPVLMGGLGEYLKFNPTDETLQNYHYINAALCQIAKENKNFYYVSAKGLSCKPDVLHFNAKALREFGERFYEAFAAKRSVFDAEIQDEILAVELENDPFLLANAMLKKMREDGRITKEEYEQKVLALKREV